MKKGIKLFFFVLCIFLVLLVVFLNSACRSIPSGIVPVANFEKERYLGKWYEIARLDHSFERGLSDVTAEYSKNEDGKIKVVNKGYSNSKKKWKSVVGKARFMSKKAEEAKLGHLRVSFFGPFYGPYIIFYLDKEYQNAFVCSFNKKYLWYLSREPKVSKSELNNFIKKAKERGFEVGKLIFVNQDKNKSFK